MSCEINKKIEKELYEYVNFKKEFQFTFKDIINKGNIQYCDDFPICDEEGVYISECEKWINVGYQIKGFLSKILSNLYPYEFVFRGFHLKSIEAFFRVSSSKILLFRRWFLIIAGQMLTTSKRQAIMIGRKQDIFIGKVNP